MSQLPDDATTSADETSKILIERLKSRDRTAFEEWFRTYHGLVYIYLIRLVRDDIVAQELTEDTFLRLWSILPDIKRDVNLQALLYRIASNMASDYLRRSRFLQEKELKFTFPEETENDSQYFNELDIAIGNIPEIVEEISLLGIRIIEEPLTAQNLSTIIVAITDLYTRCWLILQKRFSDLMDYTQTRDPRFVREANLRVGAMSHNSPAIFDLLLNAGTIAGGTATLMFALTKAIDAIAQTPLRFEATKLKNLKEKQEQEIRGKQAELDQKISAQKAESEDKAREQEQQLDAERKLLEMERQRMLLDIEKQKLEVEAEKQRTALDRERLEFEKNRVIIVQEIAVTMVGQLLSSEDRGDAGRTEMLVHSLIPSLLQLAATDGIVTVVPTDQPNEENKGSSEKQ